MSKKHHVVCKTKCVWIYLQLHYISYFTKTLFYLVKPIFNENDLDIKNADGKVKQFIRKCWEFICTHTYICIFSHLQFHKN